ncbi:MAG: phosphoribosylamine--glycine ligase, partial [Parvularculaceae bacterium]
MNILLVGGGGREHSLAWKLAQSPALTRLVCAPGNPGMADIAACVAIADSDIEGLVKFASANSIDLVVVGPEAPLAAGLGDRLAEAGIACFGPNQAAAQLESSKGFVKDLCTEYNIPTARYGRFSKVDAAVNYIDQMSAPYVIKADGLAAGKGVIIAETRAEAITAINDLLDGKFGNAGSQVVIEEFMHGEEASFFALCDGETILPLIAAQDHKRAFDGDKGPNTGGMGAYSPAPVFTPEIFAQTMDQILKPTVQAMNDKGLPYVGVLYAGLMITEDGPKLIEYNARFGDPECQVLMRRMKSDLLPLLRAAATRDLAG